MKAFEEIDEDLEDNDDGGWVSMADLMPKLIDLLHRRATWPKIGRDDNYFVKLKKLAKYYEIELPFIMKHHEDRPTMFYRSYPYDWSLFQTPIEQQAWNVIRSLGHIVMYPQFPVGRFHLDFAAPHLKIGLELDGAQWHDETKDRARDKELKALGWKIYRVSGSEMNKVIPPPLEQEYECSQDAEQALIEFICESGEGVIYAIRVMHFLPLINMGTFRPNIFGNDHNSGEQWAAFIKSVCYNSLQDHTYFYQL